MLKIAQIASSDDIATVQALFREYHALVGGDLCFQGFEDEVLHLPGAYAPPSGRLLLATYESAPVGCAALRDDRASRCEMKRLFVRPAARGLGVGRALVSRILDEARAIGYSEVVLDTLPTMVEAQRLYRLFGFRDIPPYRSNPVEGTRYLAKSLTGT
jgi:ribosomal protein S18 acetylase RimI-like enzyme